MDITYTTNKQEDDALAWALAESDPAPKDVAELFSQLVNDRLSILVRQHAQSALSEPAALTTAIADLDRETRVKLAQIINDAPVRVIEVAETEVTPTR